MSSRGKRVTSDDESHIYIINIRDSSHSFGMTGSCSYDDIGTKGELLSSRGKRSDEESLFREIVEWKHDFC